MTYLDSLKLHHLKPFRKHKYNFMSDKIKFVRHILIVNYSDGSDGRS